MKYMLDNYKKIINKKNKLFIIICIIFLIGFICGSLYITILKNDDKTLILNKVTSFINSYKNVSTDNKFIIFKETFINNLIYFISMWAIGISIIGIPIIFIMLFFKSFVVGFSISSIYAKYKLKSFLLIFAYLFPNNIINLVFSIFLAFFSCKLSIDLFSNAFKKKTLNFGLFMGKYFFLLLIAILICVFTSLFEAFITPNIYNLYFK